MQISINFVPVPNLSALSWHEAPANWDPFWNDSVTFRRKDDSNWKMVLYGDGNIEFESNDEFDYYAKCALSV